MEDIIFIFFKFIKNSNQLNIEREASEDQVIFTLKENVFLAKIYE